MAVRPVSSRSSASRIMISVRVSTLDVASSRIRKRGLCASARAKLTSCRWPTENVDAALADHRVEALWQRIEERAQADFAQRSLDGCAVHAFGAQPDVGFERAGEKKWILQHDAKLAAQVVHVQLANVDAVEQNLPALDFVEAQQELDRGGLARAGMADDCDRLPRLDAEGNVAQHPVFVLGIVAAGVGEPDVAELDFAAHLAAHGRPSATCGGAARRAA